MPLSASPQLLQLLLGLALCLFGWLCYWGGLHVLGALVGVALGMGLGWLAIRAGELYNAAVPVLGACALIGALIGIFLIRQIHRGFFLVAGALVGLVAGLQVVLWLQATGEWGDWLKPTGAATGLVLGAGLFLLLSRHIIILITAVIGAAMAATAYAFRDPLLLFLIFFFGALILQTGVVRLLRLPSWNDPPRDGG